MVNPNRFYTYAYLREDRTPYYIGKGQGKRIYQSKGKPCGIPKNMSRMIYLKQNLTEDEAFRHEIYMIAVFGRKNLGTGILHNRTNGGEGASGKIVSKKTKNKLSSINIGKKVKEETKLKISQSSKGRVCNEETKIKISNANKGKVRNLETRKKISEILRNRIIREETREKRRKNFSGEKNPSRRPEVLEKRIKTQTGRKLLPEHCKNIGKSKSGVKWWNNGEQTKFCKECPGDGWVLGRKLFVK